MFASLTGEGDAPAQALHPMPPANAPSAVKVRLGIIGRAALAAPPAASAARSASRSVRNSHSVPSGSGGLDTGTQTAAENCSGTRQCGNNEVSSMTTACPNSASRSPTDPRKGRAGCSNRLWGSPQQARIFNWVVASSSKNSAVA